jgi:Tfp pilus assembly protein PilO
LRFAKRNISKREKGLIVAGGAVTLIFVLTQYVVLPYWDSFADTAEKLEIQSKRVGSYRRVLRGQNSVRAALQAVQQQTASSETGLLTSKSDPLANAEIQGLVKGLATSKGMSFQRSDSLPVKGVSPEYSKVSTRVEITGAINQLVDFLAGFETAPKILFVEEMRISPVQMGNPKNKQVHATLMISALKQVDQGNVPPGKRS